MLSRGLLDALPLWPVAVWPIVFSSALWAFLRICQLSRANRGVSVLDRASPVFVPAWVYLGIGIVFEMAVHACMLWLVGMWYALIALPVFIFGWTALPALLDDFSPAVIALPAIHVFFAAAFLVLLGVVDIGILRAANAEFYGLLTGGRVSL